MDGASSIQSADLSWLDKPDVFRVNRLDAHSDHRCYATQDEVERDSSSLIMPLDGTWKFKYSPNPQARPVGFHQLAEAPPTSTTSQCRGISKWRDMTRTSTSTPCTRGRAVSIAALPA